MSTPLTTVDTNTSQSDLSHLEGLNLHRHRIAEAQTATSIIQDLIRECGPSVEEQLASIDINNPTAEEDALIVQILGALTDEQWEIINNGINDTLIVADPYANGMTRPDLPERTEGTITVDGDPSGFVDPMPGQYGSEYPTYRAWALDQITTLLTGIHPTRGEVPISKARSLALLRDKRFRNMVKKSGVALKDLYEAVNSHADHPVEDDYDDSRDVPWLSHYQHRNDYSRFLPPPAPEDETPPNAQRPRRGSFRRGISMDQALGKDEEYIDALHQGTELLRQACDTDNPVLRDALIDAARSLSRSIIAMTDKRRNAFAAVATRFTRKARIR